MQASTSEPLHPSFLIDCSMKLTKFLHTLGAILFAMLPTSERQRLEPTCASKTSPWWLPLAPDVARNQHLILGGL